MRLALVPGAAPHRAGALAGGDAHDRKETRLTRGGRVITPAPLRRVPLTGKGILPGSSVGGAI